MDPRRDRLALAALLLATFALRALRADQPIVENYVGRQVPTAMVARNLDRGSGLLRPQLDKFKTDTAAATKLLSVGESPRNEKLDVPELAAWTMVGSTILNSDETLTKG